MSTLKQTVKIYVDAAEIGNSSGPILFAKINTIFIKRCLI